MTKHDPWFFEERAVAFASLMLTKRHDVAVKPRAGADMAIDLLVEVRQDGKPTPQRRFGVQIVSYMDLPSTRDADERVLSHLPRNRLESELPVCVFVIGVRKPEGLFRWYVEPVVEGGRPRLLREVKPSWQPLDEAGVDRLIEQVNTWYDASEESPVPASRSRHPNTESA
jgi:hypothetical protein